MRKKLILRSITSSEVDLNSWVPYSEEDVYICLDIEVGFSGDDDGSNMFYVTLASPKALERKCGDGKIIRNRVLVTSNYSLDKIRNEIVEILDESTRETWHESCAVLQRYFQWEYEDYSSD